MRAVEAVGRWLRKELSKEKPSWAIAVASALLQHFPRHISCFSTPLLNQTRKPCCPCSLYQPYPASVEDRMEPASANLLIAQDYSDDAESAGENARPQLRRRITRSNAKANELNALIQKSAPTSKPAAKRSSKRPLVNSPMNEDDSSDDELPQVVQDAEDEEEGCEDSDQFHNSEAESQRGQVRQRPKKSRKQERSSNPRSNVAKKDKYGNRILKPMTLTQRAVCGLPHETGHELLYLPGHTSQADLKDMSYYLMILVDRQGRVI
jgi:hypothetical protein